MRIPIPSSSLYSFLPFLTLILALPAPVSSSSSPSPSPSPELGTDTHLTPTTFAPTIAQGLWFVEHYSPWCGHCRHFRPTWEKLVEDAGRGVWEGVGAGGGKDGGKGKDGEGGEDLKEVRMGSVDCSVHGDLCDANNIKGYPTLLMFHNGQVIDTFKGPRELEDLKKFMSRHVIAVRGVKEEEDRVKAEAEKAKTAAEEKAKAKVEEQSKLVKQQVDNNANTKAKQEINVNPNGEVLSLTYLTFTSFLSPSESSVSPPPTFVKFFAPWCGHCKKLAPTWRLLAKHMQGKVVIAEVDCDANGNRKVCEAEGVQGYPTLVWYPGGVGGVGEGKAKGMVYEQGRKLEQLKAFAEKASSAGVEPISNAQELDKHIAEEEVMYLLLHSEGDDEIVSQIRNAASPLLGSPLILSSSTPSLFERYSLSPTHPFSSFNPTSSSAYVPHKPWVIISFKDHDNIFPSSIFFSASFVEDGKGKVEMKVRGMDEAREWMLGHRVPSAVELTRDTFQSVMNAPQKPVVVLALSSAGVGVEGQGGEGATEEKVMGRLRDLGRKWRMRNRKRVTGEGGGSVDGDEGVFEGREVVFAWMDNGKWEDWVKSMYGSRSVAVGEGRTLEDVRVVIADHANLVYYDTDSAGNVIRFTSSASIFTAVEDALRGRTAFKHSEGVVERIARYLNNKLQSLEHSVTSHPIHSFLLLVGVLGGVFWILSRVVGSGAGAGDSRGAYERGREEWREVKGRSGRLD